MTIRNCMDTTTGSGHRRFPLVRDMNALVLPLAGVHACAMLSARVVDPL